MAISMLKIRRPLGRLIFNMGIAIPGKTVFLIETAPWNIFVFTRVFLITARFNYVMDPHNKRWFPIDVGEFKRKWSSLLILFDNDVKC